MKDKTFWILTIVSVGIMAIELAGCVSNHYKITTAYTSPADSVTITSEIEGKNTIGKVSYIYQKVLSFVDAEYLKKK